MLDRRTALASSVLLATAPLDWREYTALAPLGPAGASVGGAKRTRLPLAALCQILGNDLVRGAHGRGGYFVSGDLTPEIFADDCRFSDPTNDVTSLAKYVKVISRAASGGCLLKHRGSRSEIGMLVLSELLPSQADEPLLTQRPASLRRSASSSTRGSPRSSCWTAPSPMSPDVPSRPPSERKALSSCPGACRSLPMRRLPARRFIVPSRNRRHLTAGNCQVGVPCRSLLTRCPPARRLIAPSRCRRGRLPQRMLLRLSESESADRPGDKTKRAI